MSSNLVLNCLIWGDYSSNGFEINIERIKSVDSLIKAIKQKKGKADDIAVRFVDVAIPNDGDDIEAFKSFERAIWQARNRQSQIRESQKLSEIFQDKFIDRNLHVVVDIPQFAIPLELACIVHSGTIVSSDPFVVTIDRRQTTAALRELIQHKAGLQGYLFMKTFKIWGVSIPIDDSFEEKVKDTDRRQDLPALDPLSVCFPIKPTGGHLNVIVEGPKAENFPADSHANLRLWCIVRDANASLNTIFLVDIGHDKFIYQLKEAIKDKKKPEFDHIAADSLKLYRVSIPIDYDLPKEVMDLQYSELLLPHRVLSAAFPVVTSDHLSVVVVAPAGPSAAEEVDIPVDREKRNKAPALRRRFLTALDTISKALAPAKSAKASGYIKSQIDYCICDGRYRAGKPKATVAPPVQLFHPVFAHFLNGTKNGGEIPPDIMVMAASYMIEATAIYDKEDDRRNHLGLLLGDLLNVNIQLIVNDDNTRPDGVLEFKTTSGHFAVLLVKEDKNEFGEGNSDPSTQVGLSMVRSWIQPRLKSIRNRTCCPTFLIANAGPWIAVLGAVFTDVVIIQRLTDYIWIGLDSTENKEHCNRVARVLYSLRESIAQLKCYYNELKPAVDPTVEDSRFFPAINAYHDEDGKLITFEYKGYLENDPSCVTLLAERPKETESVTRGPKKQKIQETEKIVVKFVDRYGKGPHEVLAKAQRGPKLYYCGKPGVNEQDPTYGEIQIVVMEYIDGMTVSEAARMFGLEHVEVGLKDCLRILHENNYVFGDLRPPNVIVTNQGRVMLVDLDWAGCHGKTLYPELMSPRIQWAQGVGPFKVMQKEHDIEMMKKLLDELR